MAFTHEEIANRVGKSRQLVGYWRNGEATPLEPERALLEASFGIPGGDWDLPYDPATNGGPPAPLSLETKSARDLALEFAAYSRELVDQIRADPNASPQAKIRAAQQFERAVKLAASTELDERKILQSPEWKRIVDAIRGALHGHPEAERAVALALKELERS